MRKLARYCRRGKLHDPEPLTIALFVFAAISATSEVYLIGRSEFNAWDSRRRKRRNKKATVLLWEAGLLEFGDLLEELKEFLASVSKYRNEDLLSRPLDPLTKPLYLDGRELDKYRKIVGKLAIQGKKMSDTTCDLLPEIEDKKLGEFLEKSIPHAREILQQIKKMESLEKVLAAGFEFIEELKKVAEYLRKEIVT
jgi:hypothetical protein